VIGVSAQQKVPLKLSHTTPYRSCTMAISTTFWGRGWKRLFATAEENSKVLVFDLKANPADPHDR